MFNIPADSPNADTPSGRRSSRAGTALAALALGGAFLGYEIGSGVAEAANTADFVDHGSFLLQGDPGLDDGELTELVGYVETATGRRFEEPPRIVVQSPEDYREQLADVDETELGDASELEARYLQAVVGDDRTPTEVADLTVEMMTTGFAGYYDPETDQLYLPAAPGEPATDRTRSVLVHELTHALDDQYVDLAALINPSGSDEAADAFADREAVTSAQIILEGRAMSVQNSWNEANGVVLTAEPEEIELQSKLPLATGLSLALPYEIGPLYIDAVGGPEATGYVLDDPLPSTDELVFGPTAASITVPAPTVDGEVLAEWELGAAELYVSMVADHGAVTPEVAQAVGAAVDGWAGGTAVLTGDDTESCVAGTVVMEDETEAAELAVALDAWAARNEGRTVSVEADTVSFTGCAPYRS
ncbi:MAG: hypothetical protein ACK5RL_15535 [Acidimicrobiales bacterium]